MDAPQTMPLVCRILDKDSGKFYWSFYSCTHDEKYIRNYKRFSSVQKTLKAYSLDEFRASFLLKEDISAMRKEDISAMRLVEFFKKFKYKTVAIRHATVVWKDMSDEKEEITYLLKENGFGKRKVIIKEVGFCKLYKRGKDHIYYRHTFFLG